MFIDSHCHFDLYPTPKDIIKESENLGIITIGMTNLPSHFKMGYPHIQNYKKVRLALGMHPLMAEYHSKELPLFYKYLDMTSYIGEIGLDFSREGMSTKNIQLDSFEKILAAVSKEKKILSIHSRKAEKEVLQLLKEYKIHNAIFHWYSGGVKLIDQIIDEGYYFSVNTAMIKSESGKKIIKRIPKEFILTETDGPFIKRNNTPVKPKDIKLVIDYLQNIFNSKSMEVQVYQNFVKLLNRIK
ncbi:Qat anti-phage system TatD family nuclease QatD [Aquimarina algicola]|uniref:TatD family deoxyribonuclease n=1 Tax=Aquimarina algicola TaxID=2589995 RepID=A0A504JEN5_9FLAO|nr:Qat anti-phage system TatD family nuclease QatD [Aquimarina algicola]TPN86083.1 TatD family deoxyribonuclease [Aquimarina algicola]